ncbi:MAG: hypothetical protein ACOXZK_05360 [Bacteroidales bacterium]|jgi:hypothetical protein
MKKNFLVLAIVLAGFFTAQAQVNPHAIGLRFGGGTAFGGELSYQMGMGSSNRLELDLGWSGGKDYSYLNLAAIYHWNWNITEGLNWYVGPGANVGLYSHKYDDNGLMIGVGGQIGLEYDFNSHSVPLLLSLDTRPMFHLNRGNGLWWGAALGLRYTF